MILPDFACDFAPPRAASAALKVRQRKVGRGSVRRGSSSHCWLQYNCQAFTSFEDTAYIPAGFCWNPQVKSALHVDSVSEVIPCS